MSPVVFECGCLLLARAKLVLTQTLLVNYQASIQASAVA
jgi:hypothetical protein